MDSVTNTPKPITSRDGFYQCVELHTNGRRDSVSTVSTMESGIEEEGTLPTAWSPYSSPERFGSDEEKRVVAVRTFSVDSRDETIVGSDLTKSRTFGQTEKEEESWAVRIPGRNSVGVAF